MKQTKRLKPFNTVINQLNELSNTLQYTYVLNEDKYTGSYTKVECKCNKCNYEWTTQLCNLLNTKSSCSRCNNLNRVSTNGGRRKLYTKEYLIEQLDRLSSSFNYTYTIPEDIHNCHNTQIQCKCNNCNHIWSTTPYSLIKKETSCKLCYLKNRGGRSIQEDEIINIIKHIDPTVAIINNHKILKVPFSKYPQEVDIHITSLNKAIEFNDSYTHNNSNAKRRTKGYCSTVEEWHTVKTESFNNQFNGTLYHINDKEWDGLSYDDKIKYIKAIIFDL